MFVYQEWDVLKERSTQPEERLEKVSQVPTRTQSFSAVLQEARLKRRQTLHDLAENVGVSVRTMSMYENGTEMPSKEILERIQTELGIE